MNLYLLSTCFTEGKELEIMEKGLLTIIKPTNACNLACSYCYVESNACQGVMTMPTMRQAVTKISRYNGHDKESHFIWHGGEPTLVGQPFYQDVGVVTDELRNDGYTLTHSIQTNGTRLNDKDVEFFVAQGFRIGLSIDGPQAVHDQTRMFPDGNGSFNRVWRTVEAMRSFQQGISGIVVLTRLNLPSLEAIYKFYRNNHMSLRVNPLIHAGTARKNWEDISITPEEYGHAVIRLFDWWINDQTSEEIVDPPQQMLRMLMNRMPLGCHHLKSCQDHFISVDPAGNVYPCGRFDGRSGFKYGNLVDHSVEEVLASASRNRLLSRSELIEECKACPYQDICHSGCMENALNDGEVMLKDPYCVAYRMAFDHIRAYLEASLPDGPTPIDGLKMAYLFDRYVHLDGIANKHLRRAARLANRGHDEIEYYCAGEHTHRDYTEYPDYSEGPNHTDYP